MFINLCKYLFWVTRFKRSIYFKMYLIALGHEPQ